VSAPTFEYSAVAADGRRERGVTGGASRADAYRIITARGLTPVRIEPVGGTRRKGGAGRRPSLKDISHVTHQFGALIAAGITISESLRAIAEQEPPGPLREMLLDIESGVQPGKSLADAMHAHRATLGDAYVEAVRAAQRSGTLAPVLEHLSEMLKRSIESARQARGCIRRASSACSCSPAFSSSGS
jgi:type II secretory pathway component PulF